MTEITQIIYSLCVSCHGNVVKQHLLDWILDKINPYNDNKSKYEGLKQIETFMPLFQSKFLNKIHMESNSDVMNQILMRIFEYNKSLDL